MLYLFNQHQKILTSDVLAEALYVELQHRARKLCDSLHYKSKPKKPGFHLVPHVMLLIVLVRRILTPHVFFDYRFAPLFQLLLDESILRSFSIPVKHHVQRSYTRVRYLRLYFAIYVFGSSLLFSHLFILPFLRDCQQKKFFASPYYYSVLTEQPGVPSLIFALYL